MHKAYINAYQSVNKTTLSGPELEAEILTAASRKLKECQETWDGPDHEQRLHDALKYNQKLWTLFQTDLSDEENQLPKTLRENLLSLSLFIDKRIFDTMAFPSPEKLTILININTNIAAGLRESARGLNQQKSRTTENQQSIATSL